MSDMTNLQEKTWRANCFLRSPMLMEHKVEGAEPGDFPEQYGKRQPIIAEVIHVPAGDNVHFYVSPFVEASEWDLAQFGAPLRAVVDVIANTDEFHPIVSVVEIYLDRVLDHLSYIWHYPVTCYRITGVDITSPVSVGDQRPGFQISGYSTPKFRSCNYQYDWRKPQSQFPDYEAIEEPVRAALRWYSLSLAEQPDVQRFMALWIALEIIVKAKVADVKIPYTAPCGHEIPRCPECDRSTIRQVGGKKIQDFFIEHLQVPKDIAKRLWKIRQIMHGANKLRSEDVEEIPKAVSILAAIVRVLLDQHLGMQSHVGLLGMPAMSWIGVRGSTTVSEADLDFNIRNFERPTTKMSRVEFPGRKAPFS